MNFNNKLNINTMKKILLFMLPVMALIFTSCEKNNENELSGDDVIQFEDPNFLKALLDVKKVELYDAERKTYVEYLIDVDANHDGEITVKEAKNVRALFLYRTSEDGDWIGGYDIENVPEIKYFTALEFFDCADNQLTSLDLSRNTALEFFNCGNNQLTSLDLSRNTALTSLGCSNNQLTSLDLSKNTALINLFCSENQLTSLDLSKNTALTDLWCGNNQLTSLDLSKNTALTSLDCSDNQLTSLDLSRNTALTSLGCSNNQLTSLDLSKNTALTDLYCSNNPLQELILYKYNIINDRDMESIEFEYGGIIEYVE